MSVTRPVLSSAQLDDDSPHKRGYSAPPEMRAAIARAHQTRLWRTAAAAAIDCISIAVSPLAAMWVIFFLAAQFPVAGITCIFAEVVMARQLRGLECMVHEASHFNWSRNHRTVNDILGTLLAGLPTGSRINAYRAGHLLHHGRFGTADDSDLIRYRQLGIENLRRTSMRVYSLDIARTLPKYQLGWFKAIRSSPLTFAASFMWAGSAVVAPAFALFGLRGAIAGTAMWLVADMIALPVIRFVGEAGEHLYIGNRTVFDATISNVGLLQRLLIHPHNDGYHTIHHMWPGVPHHQLRRLHSQLIIADPENYGLRVRLRTRIIQVPVAGVHKGER